MNPEQPGFNPEDAKFTDPLAEELRESHEQYDANPSAQSRGSKIARTVGKLAVWAGVTGLLGSPSEGVAQHHEKPEGHGPTPNLVTPTPEVTAPAKTPEAHPIPAAELAKIIEATGYTSLSNHHLSPIESLTISTGQRLEVISMDGAEQTVPKDELLKQREFFSDLARLNKTIDYVYNPPGKGAQHAEFQLTPRKFNTDYIIFAPKDFDLGEFDPQFARSTNTEAITNPNDVMGAATTIINKSYVALDSSYNRVNSDYMLSAIESCQAEVEITGGNEDLSPQLGQENVCRGLGRAFRFAAAGYEYQDFQQFMGSLAPMNEEYAALGAREYAVDQATYNQMRQTLESHP